MVRQFSSQSLERALRMCQVVLAIALVMMVVKLARPIESDGNSVSEVPAPDDAQFIDGSSDHESLKPLAWYEPLWTRDLRQPPIPPIEKPKPVATPKPVPMPTLPRLMGTFVEGETAWAHLLSPQVGVRVLQLNERIEDFEISAIEPGRVQLTWRDQTRWIEIKRPTNAIAQRP